jgi:hypothetical protein
MRTASLSAVAIVIATAMATLAATVAGAADVVKVPAFDEFIVVPLRVHVLTSKGLGLANCTIKDAEVAKAAAGINAIWAKAGVSFGLESIVREPAAQVERFRALVELNGGEFPNADVYAYLLPTSSRVFDGLHVYLFHELPFNGAYINAADAAILIEKPDLRKVKGGGDDPVARVAAQGLGRALGLPGREDEVGLLSSGTNGLGLNETEVARARSVARTIPGALKVSDAAKAAEAATKKGDIATARRLWTWLSAVPGAGAAEAKKRLAALPATVKP